MSYTPFYFRVIDVSHNVSIFPKTPILFHTRTHTGWGFHAYNFLKPLTEKLSLWVVFHKGPQIESGQTPLKTRFIGTKTEINI